MTLVSEYRKIGTKQLHFVRTGTRGKPCLVLVHGFSDSLSSWLPVAQELGESFDLVLPDMHGHGKSDRLAPGQEPDMPADLAELVRVLDLHDPIFCGHSMGAMTVFQTAVRFPGLARALFLEDPPWFVPGTEPQAPMDDQSENPMVKWAKNLPQQSLAELIEVYGKGNPHWSKDFLLAMCEAKKQLDQNIIEPMARKIMSRDWHWSQHLGALDLPCMVLSGNPALGGIVGPGVEDRIRQLSPAIQIKNFPDQGHLIRFDNHAGFMKELKAFLGTVLKRP